MKALLLTLCFGCSSAAHALGLLDAYDLALRNAVSYTHLTLPTMRIV